MDSQDERPPAPRKTGGSWADGQSGATEVDCFGMTRPDLILLSGAAAIGAAGVSIASSIPLVSPGLFYLGVYAGTAGIAVAAVWYMKENALERRHGRGPPLPGTLGGGAGQASVSPEGRPWRERKLAGRGPGHA